MRCSAAPWWRALPGQRPHADSFGQRCGHGHPDGDRRTNHVGPSDGPRHLRAPRLGDVSSDQCAGFQMPLRLFRLAVVYQRQEDLGNGG
jgi:hypothetical protein